jgi:hypothetical protein
VSARRGSRDNTWRFYESFVGTRNAPTVKLFS